MYEQLANTLPTWVIWVAVGYIVVSILACGIFAYDLVRQSVTGKKSFLP